MRCSIKLASAAALLSLALVIIPAAASAANRPAASVKLAVTSNFPLKGGEVKFRVQYTRGNTTHGLLEPILNGRSGKAKRLPIKVRVGDVVEVSSLTIHNGFGRSKYQRHKITLLDIKHGYVFHFKMKWVLLVPPVSTPIEVSPIATPVNPAAPVAPPASPADPPVNCDHIGFVSPKAGDGTVNMKVIFRMSDAATFVRADFDTSDGVYSSHHATYDPQHGVWEADYSHAYRFSNKWHLTVAVVVSINGIVRPTLVTTEIQADSPDPANPTTCSTSVDTTGLPPLPPDILPPPDIRVRDIT